MKRQLLRKRFTKKSERLEIVETTTTVRPTSLHWGLSTDATNQTVAASTNVVDFVDQVKPLVISYRRDAGIRAARSVLQW